MKLQVGVKVLLQNKSGEFLFLKRAAIMDTDEKIHWDIPGGRIEPEEPLMEALTREVQEETGLSIVGEPKIIGSQDIFVPSKDLHVVRLTYIAEGDGQPTLSDEHQDFTWMKIKDMDRGTIDPYLEKLLPLLEAN